MTDTLSATLLRKAEKERGKSGFKPARRLFLRAARAAQHPLLLAQAWQGAADCARLLGDFPASVHDYGLALKAAPPKDKALRTDLACGEALAWRGAGEPKKALRGLAAALTSYTNLGDFQGQAFCHWALGGAWRIAGDLPKALAALTSAEKAYRRLKQPQGLAYVALGFSELEALRGKNKLSLNKLSQAAQLARGFAWETRHVRALSAIVRERPSTAYARSGSRFKPSSLPVNWP